MEEYFVIVKVSEAIVERQEELGNWGVNVTGKRGEVSALRAKQQLRG